MQVMVRILILTLVMNTLRLAAIGFDERTGKHTVHTGNGVFQEFTNKKDAESFLVNLSKRITKNFQIAYLLYTDCDHIISNYIFDLNMYDHKRYLELKTNIEDRTFFILHRYTAGSNLFIINTVLYIYLQIKEVIILGLSSIKKIKYHGHELKLESSLEQVDKLINDLKIKSKVVYSDPGAFAKDYSKLYKQNVA